jgi:hypothetical protein
VSNSSRRFATIDVFILLAAVSMVSMPCATAFAQQAPVALHVTAADRAAAASATFRYHLTPARTPAGATATRNGPQPFSLDTVAAGHNAAATDTAATVRPLLTKVHRPGFYPADLTFIAGLFGGTLSANTIVSAVMQNVYLGCADGSCWGDPQGFEQDLVKSRFLRLVNKYVGSHAKNRYSVGTEIVAGSVGSNCTNPGFCSENDIIAIALAASASGGAGKGHMYHIFLPAGTDTCFAGDTICYSPDNLSTFGFCAYHGAVVSGLGTTYFTVEPYQDVAGCAVSTQDSTPPNGQLADSTDSVLSHEIFETLTDPDLGSGWLALNSLNELGFEIGDECQGPPDNASNALVPIVKVHGNPYKVQLEYSNKYHACSERP